MIQKHYHQLIEEVRVIKKRSIQKQKRKNQYSVEFNFGSAFDFDTLMDILQVQMEIPSRLSLEPQLRFKSDIQVPQLLSQSEQLGCLMVDWFSRNYKVRKIDTKENLLIITLDAYDTPFAEFDEYFEILKERCPQVTQNFKKFQQMLENYSYEPWQLNTFEQLNDFEQGILKNFPAQGYITRSKDQSRTTIAKIYNNQMLQFIGVNQQIMSHYALETNLIPTHLYVDPNDEQYVQINKCYEANSDPNQELKFDFITYNGQRWSLPSQIYRFVIPEQRQNSFLEYTFYVIQPEKYQFLNENDILDNYRKYFNLKTSEFKLNEQDSDTSENQKQRCGFKSIL